VQRKFTRREFLKATGYAASTIALTECGRQMLGDTALHGFVKAEKPVVSVVRIKNDNIDYAVRESIDLLGGINTISANKEKIMLKPNLVSPDPRDTTNPQVTEEISTFSFAWKAGMTPKSIDEIEVRGTKVNSVKRSFIRPIIYPWGALKEWWGLPC